MLREERAVRQRTCLEVSRWAKGRLLLAAQYFQRPETVPLRIITKSPSWLKMVTCIRTRLYMMCLIFQCPAGSNEASHSQGVLNASMGSGLPCHAWGLACAASAQPSVQDVCRQQQQWPRTRRVVWATFPMKQTRRCGLRAIATGSHNHSKSRDTPQHCSPTSPSSTTEAS